MPYADRLDQRDLAEIDLLVIHCTELPDLESAREYGERIHHEESQTGNSGHYYIEKDGSLHCWVETDRVAHHVISYNHRSIGIELLNKGRWPDWFNSNNQVMTDPYPEDQIASLIHLIRHLQANIPALKFISGHENLDESIIAASDAPTKLIRRKLDPGPLFPWPQVLKQTGLTFLQAK